MPRLETSGYKGWWPMIEMTGRKRSADGRRIQVGREVIRNMVTGETVEGWDSIPPCPTGETPANVRHYHCDNEELWRNMELRREHTIGTIVHKSIGRTVIVYR